MPEVTILEMAEEGDDTPPREAMVVDVPTDKIKDFRIGQEITMTVKGSVGMMSVPPDGLQEGEQPEMGIRVTSKTIEGMNAFEELAMDKDED